MKLYTLSRSDPPQNSDELPTQTMLHPEAAAGTPPLEKPVPQSVQATRSPGESIAEG